MKGTPVLFGCSHLEQVGFTENPEAREVQTCFKTGVRKWSSAGSAPSHEVIFDNFFGRVPCVYNTEKKILGRPTRETPL
jgi:hypothetical protein